MSQQLQQPFQFRFPAERQSVLYLQTPAGWRKLPPEAGDSGTSIRLYVSPEDPRQTVYEIDRGDGHPHGGYTGFFWPSAGLEKAAPPGLADGPR